MFKVNYTNTEATSMVLFWCLYINFEHISSVSTVDVEQVNV